MIHHTTYAKFKPKDTAIILSESGKTISWEEYDRRVNQLGQYFKDIGLKEKDNIAILLENSKHYLEIMDAAVDAGLLYTAISTHLKENEVEYIINNCEAKMLITSEKYADLAGRVIANTPNLNHRLMLGKAKNGFDSYEETISRYEGVPIEYNIAGMPMFYSSGTTGQPKGIVWEAEDWHVGTLEPTWEATAALFQLDSESIYLSTAPLYHSAPSGTALLTLLLGGTVVLMEKFDPEQALLLIEKYRVTHSQWVPTMFIRMLKLPEMLRNNYDISSLKLAIHAAAPCPIKVKEQMIEWFGPILFEYWGGTETSVVTAITSEEWQSHKGSVGKSYTAKLHIMDDDGKELPPYEPGLIYMEAGKAFNYYKEPDKTDSSRNDKGWTNIGDVGYLDDEGYLYLTDRKTFMIISGGVNIYPQETEDVLIMHEKVADVAVIGVPNEEFGEEVKAVVKPTNMEDVGPELEEELIEYCRSKISNIKCPKSIDFMEEFPRTPAGKLMKRVIKEKIN